jgi:cation diffusion facilitator CzcD-associated flavoprotein CzcO
MLHRAGYDNVTVFERGERVGGVWHHNTYPGAACDVPSHFYEFSFAPNPNWSRRYAPQPEIQAYIEEVARRYDVRDRIRTNTDVLSARWDAIRNKWLIKTSAGDHEADVLITACGQLSVPKLPALTGLETFQGPAFHTAQWRHDVDLASKRVAVIGTGCSAIQVVPAIHPYVAHLSVYQRSPAWTIPRLDFAYSTRAQWAFAHFPALQRLDRAAIFGFLEFGTLAMTSLPWLRPICRAIGRLQIARAISDPDLRRKVTPVDEVGCKRVMPTTPGIRRWSSPTSNSSTTRLPR